MASIREMETKTGGICYEVGVSRGRGKSKVYRRFYPEAGWSKRTIDRELNKFVRDLEKEVEAGQTVSREERKEKELEAMRSRKGSNSKAIWRKGLYAYQKGNDQRKHTKQFSRLSGQAYLSCIG